MTPLQSNKAAPNKNNNKKKNFPHITKKKKESSISHIVWVYIIFVIKKKIVWKILLNKT